MDSQEIHNLSDQVIISEIYIFLRNIHENAQMLRMTDSSVRPNSSPFPSQSKSDAPKTCAVNTTAGWPSRILLQSQIR